MEIEQELKLRAEKFEIKLKELYKSYGVSEKLDESMKYTLFSGGKRIRPVLTLSVYEMLGGKECNAIFLLACAVELLHNYTLIHDDLPCLDNDDFRRGRLTNHKVYGEAIALLAGDGLLSLSHEFIYEAISNAENKTLYLEAAKLISELTGPGGTVGGQALEISCDENNGDSESLFSEIINGKTCKLISAAVLSGAIVAGADEKKLVSLAKYSQSLGYAFQISDDLLDYDDKKDKEKSLVNFYGKEYAEKLLNCYIENALKSLDELSEDTEFLAEIVKYCAERKK